MNYKKLIQCVKKWTPKDEARPHLHGIAVYRYHESLVFVATNGHGALIASEFEIPKDLNDLEPIGWLPAATLTVLEAQNCRAAIRACAVEHASELAKFPPWLYAVREIIESEGVMVNGFDAKYVIDFAVCAAKGARIEIEPKECAAIFRIERKAAWDSLGRAELYLMCKKP